MPPKNNAAQTLELELARMRAENEKMKAALAEANKPRSMTLKVGQSGGLSVYGLGRFPVTLYKEQWERLLADESVKAIKDFIKANEGVLKTKAQK